MLHRIEADRTVTLFDRSGTRPPWGDHWVDPVTEALLSPTTVALLARHGMTVTTEPPDLRPANS